jgi:hypothetical protein
MPAGLSLVDELEFMSPQDRRLLSQVQGRTYADVFGLVERFIGAKVLDISRDHWFGDQLALEALVRMGDEEIKHQAQFRELDAQMTQDMPPGYQRFQKVLFGMLDEAQRERINAGLAPLCYAVPNRPQTPLPMAA